jgi:GNAT superfamily N-acetyltransferase
MKDGRPTADDVVLGTKADLDQTLEWLEREYHEDGERGFWCNRNLLPTALERGDFYVIRAGGEAVAFQLGHYAPSIANVRKDKQGQGFGTALLDASLARAHDDDVNVLDVECSPRTSLTFWEKHGFERYGDMSDWGKLTARRILNRSFELPSDAPRVPVTITFYPERIKYACDEHVEPIAVHCVSGARLPDGAVMLERRVIGLDDGPGNLVIKIEIDGEERYFDKAKYDDAEDAGVRHDWRGDNFYLDAVERSDEAK